MNVYGYARLNSAILAVQELQELGGDYKVVSITPEPEGNREAQGRRRFYAVRESELDAFSASLHRRGLPFLYDLMDGFKPFYSVPLDLDAERLDHVNAHLLGATPVTLSKLVERVVSVVREVAAAPPYNLRVQRVVCYESCSARKVSYHVYVWLCDAQQRSVGFKGLQQCLDFVMRMQNYVLERLLDYPDLVMQHEDKHGDMKQTLFFDTSGPGHRRNWRLLGHRKSMQKPALVRVEGFGAWSWLSPLAPRVPVSDLLTGCVNHKPNWLGDVTLITDEARIKTKPMPGWRFGQVGPPATKHVPIKSAGLSLVTTPVPGCLYITRTGDADTKNCYWQSPQYARNMWKVWKSLFKPHKSPDSRFMVSLTPAGNLGYLYDTNSTPDDVSLMHQAIEAAAADGRPGMHFWFHDYFGQQPGIFLLDLDKVRDDDCVRLYISAVVEIMSYQGRVAVTECPKTEELNSHHVFFVDMRLNAEGRLSLESMLEERLGHLRERVVFDKGIISIRKVFCASKELTRIHHPCMRLSSPECAQWTRREWIEYTYVNRGQPDYQHDLTPVESVVPGPHVARVATPSSAQDLATTSVDLTIVGQELQDLVEKFVAWRYPGQELSVRLRKGAFAEVSPGPEKWCDNHEDDEPHSRSCTEMAATHISNPWDTLKKIRVVAFCWPHKEKPSAVYNCSMHGEETAFAISQTARFQVTPSQAAWHREHAQKLDYDAYEGDDRDHEPGNHDDSTTRTIVRVARPQQPLNKMRLARFPNYYIVEDHHLRGVGMLFRLLLNGGKKVRVFPVKHSEPRFTRPDSCVTAEIHDIRLEANYLGCKLQHAAALPRYVDGADPTAVPTVPSDVNVNARAFVDYDHVHGGAVRCGCKHVCGRHTVPADFKPREFNVPYDTSLGSTDPLNIDNLPNGTSLTEDMARPFPASVRSFIEEAGAFEILWEYSRRVMSPSTTGDGTDVVCTDYMCGNGCLFHTDSPICRTWIIETVTGEIYYRCSSANSPFLLLYSRAVAYETRRICFESRVTLGETGHQEVPQLPNDLYDPEKGPQGVFIQAMMGGRKTTGVVEYLSRTLAPNFVVIVYRRLLATKITQQLRAAGLVDTECYLGDDGHVRSFATDQFPTRLVIGLDSIHMIPRGVEYDTVILDEVLSSCQHLLSSTMERKRALVYKTLSRVIGRSKMVIGMDAFLDSRCFDLMRLGCDERLLTALTCTMSRVERRVVFLDSDMFWRGVAKAAKDIRDDESVNVAFVVTRKTDAAALQRNLVDACGISEHDILVITADTRTLKNRGEPNELWSLYRVVIYNEAVGAGQSFTLEHFDRVFALLDPSSSLARGSLQLLLRPRCVKSLFLGVYFRPSRAAAYQYGQQSAKVLQEERTWMHTKDGIALLRTQGPVVAQKVEDEPNLDIVTREARDLVTVAVGDKTMFRTAIGNIVERNLDSIDHKKMFKAHCIKEGYTIHTVAGFNEKFDKDGKILPLEIDRDLIALATRMSKDILRDAKRQREEALADADHDLSDGALAVLTKRVRCVADDPFDVGIDAGARAFLMGLRRSVMSGDITVEVAEAYLEESPRFVVLDDNSLVEALGAAHAQYEEDLGVELPGESPVESAKRLFAQRVELLKYRIPLDDKERVDLEAYVTVRMVIGPKYMKDPIYFKYRSYLRRAENLAAFLTAKKRVALHEELKRLRLMEDEKKNANMRREQARLREEAKHTVDEKARIKLFAQAKHLKPFLTDEEKALLYPTPDPFTGLEDLPFAEGGRALNFSTIASVFDKIWAVYHAIGMRYGPVSFGGSSAIHESALIVHDKLAWGALNVWTDVCEPRIKAETQNKQARTPQFYMTRVAEYTERWFGIKYELQELEAAGGVRFYRLALMQSKQKRTTPPKWWCVPEMCYRILKNLPPRYAAPEWAMAVPSFALYFGCIAAPYMTEYPPYVPVPYIHGGAGQVATGIFGASGPAFKADVDTRRAVMVTDALRFMPENEPLRATLAAWTRELLQPGTCDPRRVQSLATLPLGEYPVRNGSATYPDLLMTEDGEVYSMSNAKVRNYAVAPATFLLKITQGPKLVIRTLVPGSYPDLPNFPDINPMPDKNAVYDDGITCGDPCDLHMQRGGILTIVRGQLQLAPSGHPVPTEPTAAQQVPSAVHDPDNFIDLVITEASRNHPAEYRASREVQGPAKPETSMCRFCLLHCNTTWNLDKAIDHAVCCSSYCESELERVRMGYYRGLGLQNPRLTREMTNWDDHTVSTAARAAYTVSTAARAARLSEQSERQRNAALVRAHLAQVRARAGGATATVRDLLEQLRLWPVGRPVPVASEEPDEEMNGEDTDGPEMDSEDTDGEMY